MTQVVAPPVSRWITFLAAAAWLTFISPVLAILSFYGVGYSMDALLEREELCVTYACGEGLGFLLLFMSFGWMCLMWILGVLAAVIAVRRTVTVGRALVAASLTALAVTAIAVSVDWGFIIWSV